MDIKNTNFERLAQAFEELNELHNETAKELQQTQQKLAAAEAENQRLTSSFAELEDELENDDFVKIQLASNCVYLRKSAIRSIQPWSEKPQRIQLNDEIHTTLKWEEIDQFLASLRPTSKQ